MMSLTEELAARKKNSSEKLAGEKWELMTGSTQALKDRQLAAKAVQEGDKLPAFNLPDINNQQLSLSSILEKGQAVISFYRGGWCPYCNMELRALQQVLPQIQAAGAQLVAISPETPDNTLSTSEKNKLSFPVLSDIDNSYAKELGLVFQMPQDLRDLYEDTFSIDVPKHNGNTDYELPMAATYIVGKNGSVIKAFISEDYTERLDPADVLKALVIN